MHIGFINYDVFKKEYSCHIEFMGTQVESKIFKYKDDMIKYINEKSYVKWYHPNEIGEMTY